MMVAEVVSPLLVSHPPIKVFYYHYHNSIRSELDDLSAAVAALEETDVSDASQSLGSLKRRVAFLDRVYSIHSSVEDEVGDASFLLPCVGTSRHQQLYQAYQYRTASGGHLATARSSAVLQVVYPALELKVKNVTHAYSIEHEDEVRHSFIFAHDIPALYTPKIPHVKLSV